MNETIGSHAVVDWSDPSRNTASWTQCDGSHTETRLVDTTQLPDGSVPISISAGDAASPANVTTYNGNLQLDNTPATINLTGPSDAPSTAGAQIVTATASAGPSGASIVCTVDGGATQIYQGTTAEIGVQGVGQHIVDCYAQNNSFDQYGNRFVTPTRTVTFTIRQPTAAAIWLRTALNAPQCSLLHVPVRIVSGPTSRHSGPSSNARVKTTTKTVTRCHVRIERRQVVTWRTVRRHGRRVRVRRVRWVSVALSPRWVNASVAHTPYGASTLVAGWLGTTDRTALVGQTITVLAATDNGQSAYTPVAATATGPDGSWSVELPAGPSRLLEAAYGGSTTTEPTTSPPVRIQVPAAVHLSLSRTNVRWGGAITISGQLLGRYVPPSGELVVLRIGWRGGSTDIGHLYTDGLGRFSSRYRFLRGNGTEHYWIWAQSVHESDYPYTPSSSPPVPITVSDR